ncbi:MAG: carboxypeptidase regulatory-like domain-containing protein [Pyrinomonadaceae bacterium]
MRHYLRPSLSALCLLLLALVIPTLLVVEAARSKPSSHAGKNPSGDAGRRASSTSEPDAGAAASVRQKYGQLPLSFEENRGQADARVQFLARNGAYSLYLAADEAALALRDASVLRIRLLGASREARARGLGELEGKSNYLVGRDPSRWRTNVPNFARVKYEGVYPGVDVVYYGNQRQLEYDFHLAPGADANLIRLSVEGADGLRIDEGGDLVLPTVSGEVRQHAPRAYQEIAGVSRTIASRYVLKGANGVGFELGDYDKSLPLVIDPVVSYSTYLGGGADSAYSVAVDAEGNAYVTGSAESWDFPVTGDALQPTRGGNAPHRMASDAFVAKLNPSGTALLYSTYLGGNGDEEAGMSIAVDGSGQIHVAGFTNSADFPTTPGAFRNASAGGRELFVAKLDAAGASLAYSTYLGGSGDEFGAELALADGGAVYVGGTTSSADFPVTPGALRTQPGGGVPGTQDGFVAKLSPTAGAGLIFSTFLGGVGYHRVDGIAVSMGGDDSVYVTGDTQSPDFPVTPNVFQPGLTGDGSSSDAYVTRLNSSGTAAIFSTFLGGEYGEGGTAVAVDAAGAAYVTGWTDSLSFPVTPGVFQRVNASGGVKAFVTKLGADGASLSYSTYFGGSNNDRANAIAVDAAGNAYVAGETYSYDLPVTLGALQPNNAGGFFDGFVLKLNPTGTSAPYVTYLGGADWDSVQGVAVGPDGGVFLTGFTNSYDFNVSPLAFQPNRGGGGGSDAFVTKLRLDATHYSVTGRVTNQFGVGLEGAEVTASGGFQATTFTDEEGFYTLSGIPVESEVLLLATRFGFTFTPQTVILKDVTGDMSVSFFGHAPLRISGRILDEYGAGMSTQVTLTSAGGTTQVFTYGDGFYSFIVPGGGDYTVTPGPDAERVFTPPSHTFSGLIGDTSFDFVGTFAPRIVGRVEDEWGNGLGNVRVTLTGPGLSEPRVDTTSDYGYFFFYNLERGADYTVTPTEPGTNRVFSPAELVFNDIEGPNFVRFNSLPPVNIGGRVADAHGNAVTATVKLMGSATREVQTFDSGYFAFPDVPRGGNYTVTVTKPGTLYTFEPPSRGVENIQELTFLEFTALPPVRIVGRVADRDNNVVRATVTLSGTVNRTTQVAESGVYTFEDLPRGGDYTVTPAFPLYTFEPVSQSVTNAQNELNVLPFEALPPLKILGSMIDEEGNRVAGATVTLSGTVNRTTTTNEYGVYSFTELPRGGTYTVTPAHELYNFEPANREFANMSSEQVAVFNAAFRRFTLSGRAADSNGAALSGVDVRLGGGYADLTQTDAGGTYAFTNLRVGHNYTVTPARAGYAFAPASHNVNDPRGDQAANFTGSHLTYTLTGRVTDAAGGAGLGGATVSLSGSLSATTQTDAQGNYAFAGLPSEGNYNVAASHPNFSFTPATRAFDNVLDNVQADFAGTRRRHQIGGRVTDGAGAALSGVTVTLGGAGAATAQTDSFGQYLFADLASGFDYTVTAAKTHYSLSPATRQLEDLAADSTVDFAATRLRHKISGRVVDASGNGFAGALVNLIGVGGVTTDSTGNFAFNDLPAGDDYSVIPSREFYSFSPSVGIFNDLGADGTVTFTATLRHFSVGGRVTEGANGVAGVTVSLSGTRTATTQTDAAGNYVFTQLPSNGTYTVTPATSAVHSFAPAVTTFNTLRFNETANFSAARRLYQVGGYALDACGRAIAGITMSLAHDGIAATAQTNATGFYTFAGVQAGYNYTLAPVGTAYTFTPPSFAFPGLSANQTANFTGRPPNATADVFALADLYVRGGSASSNFGTATQLIARLASQTKDTHESYLKFNVGQPCTVTSVRLRLYGQLSASGSLPVAVYGVPVTTWTETGTTWNSKPAAGALLRTVSIPGTTAAWYEWDVTAYVRAEVAAGRNVVAFALKGTSTTSYQVSFNSREATGANAPRLSITTP